MVAPNDESRIQRLFGDVSEPTDRQRAISSTFEEPLNQHFATSEPSYLDTDLKTQIDVQLYRHGITLRRPPRRSQNSTVAPKVEKRPAVVLPSSEPIIDRLKPAAERVVREYFARRIVGQLEGICKKIDQATMIPMIADLFFMMRDYAQQSPADPYVDIMMALHDALAAGDFWVGVSKDQYVGAVAVLTKYLNRPNLRGDHVDDAIGEFEVLGFDTTPFGVTS